MELISDKIIIVSNGEEEYIDAYVLEDFPVFAVAKYSLNDQDALAHWKWSIIHIPSEKVFSDIFKRKKDAVLFLSIFLDVIDEPKKILLTMPGVSLIQTDFAEEIRITFVDYVNWS